MRNMRVKTGQAQSTGRRHFWHGIRRLTVAAGSTISRGWLALRRKLRLGCLLRVLLVTGLLWLLAMLLLAGLVMVSGGQNAVQRADVIIVLGSGVRRNGEPGEALRRRSLLAAELWKQGYAPMILCTGGQGAGMPRSEASACQEVLIENGVPVAAIRLEDRSRSTEENALYSHELMQAQGWADGVLVTDAFHMLRAGWIFQLEGLTVYPAPVPADAMLKRVYVMGLSREVLALQWQLFKEVLNLPITYVPFA